MPGSTRGAQQGCTALGGVEKGHPGGSSPLLPFLCWLLLLCHCHTGGMLRGYSTAWQRCSGTGVPHGAETESKGTKINNIPVKIKYPGLETTRITFFLLSENK